MKIVLADMKQHRGERSCADRKQARRCYVEAAGDNRGGLAPLRSGAGRRASSASVGSASWKSSVFTAPSGL